MSSTFQVRFLNLSTSTGSLELSLIRAATGHLVCGMLAHRRVPALQREPALSDVCPSFFFVSSFRHPTGNELVPFPLDLPAATIWFHVESRLGDRT